MRYEPMDVYALDRQRLKVPWEGYLVSRLNPGSPLHALPGRLLKGKRPLQHHPLYKHLQVGTAEGLRL